MDPPRGAGLRLAVADERGRSPRHSADTEAAPEEAALLGDPARRAGAGPRVLRVRHLHLGRLGPAVADEVLAAEGREELDSARWPGPPAGGRQPAEPRDRHASADPADREGGGDLDRGQAL